MALDRREFLGAAALAASTRPPNILFILADQWRAQTLPSAGDPDLVAPHLARLAREGIYFSRAYATNPVCSPSRASILTGRFPHAVRMPRNDLQLPLDEICLAQPLRDAGYATGYIGKWHLDGDARPGFVPPGPRRRGFDYWAAFNRGHAYYDSTYFGDTPEPIRPGGFEPDYQTSLALDFIRRNRARPFFLFVSWGPPHTPRRPPPRTAQLYSPERFRLRPNVPDAYATTAREGLAAYYGLCTALDQNLGRLLEALDDLALARDTLVLFTSDHGDMLGSHGLEYKGVPFEESARVPLVMRYPQRLAPGQTSDLLISNADLMPTLLALAGVEAPAPVQGRNLAGLITTGRGERPESVFACGRLGTPGEWRMVVRGSDKLVVNTRLEPTHLFNLAQDPYEQLNRASDLAFTRTRDELSAHLTAWMKRLGDRMDPSGLKTRD